MPDILGSILGTKYGDKVRHEKFMMQTFGPLVQDFISNPNSAISDEHGNWLVEQYSKILPKGMQESFQQHVQQMRLAKAQAQGPAPTSNGSVPGMGNPPATPAPAAPPAAAGPGPATPIIQAPPDAYSNLSLSSAPGGALTPPPPMGAAGSPPSAGFGSAAPTAGASWRISPFEAGFRKGQTASGEFASQIPTLLAKMGMQRQQIAALMQDLGFTKEQAAEYSAGREVKFEPTTTAKLGDVIRTVSGRLVNLGGPISEETAPGAVRTLRSAMAPSIGEPLSGMPPPPGSPDTSTAIQTGQAQQIAAPPPLLSGEEPLRLSAAQRVAQAHGIPFDPALNPRDPYRQIPPQFHGEIDSLVAQGKEDPSIRQARLENMASLQQSRSMLGELRNIQIEVASKARADRSYQFISRELDTISKPVSDLVLRLGRLQDTLAQGTPQADALVAPELLTVMAGGQGSGLRMNEAEIARIVGGRSHWESLRAAMQKWDPRDPKLARSITPAQQQQVQDLVKAVAAKVQQKQEALNDAYSGVIGSEDPVEHRRILADVRKKLQTIDTGVAGKMPTPPEGGHNVGDKVRLRSGQTVTIKKINSDGTFDY